MNCPWSLYTVIAAWDGEIDGQHQAHYRGATLIAKNKGDAQERFMENILRTTGDLTVKGYTLQFVDVAEVPYDHFVWLTEHDYIFPRRNLWKRFLDIFR